MAHSFISQESFLFGSDTVSVYYGQELMLPEIEDALYVVDSNTESLLRSAKGFNTAVPIVSIQAGDEHKNMQSLQRILTTALDSGLDRSSTFIACGGGMICDLTAFAASVYMRGAQCVLIPTSVLAMVDACIGGKSAVNFGDIKNSIGSFYQAQSVYVCIDALTQLPEREFHSGLGEVIKMALLYDNGLLGLLQNERQALLNRQPKMLLDTIQRSLHSKAAVVANDVHDRAGRRHLNLGHTFGHALESLSNFEVLHGEAVAWGIVRASELAFYLGLSEQSFREQVKELIASYNFCVEARHPSLVHHSDCAEAIIEAMKKDKKNRQKNINCILQRALYSTDIYTVDEESLRSVL